jgi:AcrR family transcriptional regulator
MASSRRGGPRPGADAGATRSAVFAAAADAFSRRGFDGVTIDDIATAAGVNKAMIYYHFTDKLALYRDIVCEMLDEAGARVSAVVAEPVSPAEKLQRFIAGFIALADSRPYFPPLMMREMAEGALHLDAGILARMRTVFLAFARVLAEGQESGVFRAVNPVLAYMSIMGPVLLNAARERAAAQPGRDQLPMFVRVPHDELTRHMQHVALYMLEKTP